MTKWSSPAGSGRGWRGASERRVQSHSTRSEAKPGSLWIFGLAPSPAATPRVCQRLLDCTRRSPHSSAHPGTLCCWLSSWLRRCEVAWFGRDVYMCVYIYVCVCVCIDVYVYLYMCEYMFVFIYIDIYVCVCVCVCVCIYIYIYIYVRAHVCVYIYIYIYIYACVHVWTHFNKGLVPYLSGGGMEN